MRIRLALRKLVEDRKYKDILSLEEDIFSQLKQDRDAFDVETLFQILEVIKPHHYLRALDMCLKMAELLHEHGSFNDFVDVSTSFLYPTIYHSRSTSFQTPPALVKKANAILEKDLRNPKIVIPQLEMLYEVHAAAMQPETSENIIDMMEDAKRVLPAQVVLLYYNSLLQQKHYDKFFILATEMASFIAGYHFETVLNDMMQEDGFPRLKKYVLS